MVSVLLLGAFSVVALCVGCTHVHGPCNRKETLIIETTCNEGGHTDAVRPVGGISH